MPGRARGRRRGGAAPRSSPPRPAAGPTSSPRRRRSRPRRTDPKLASKWWARLGGWYAHEARPRRLRAAVAAPRARARSAEPRRVHGARRGVAQAAASGRSSPTRCARTPRSRPIQDQGRPAPRPRRSVREPARVDARRRSRRTRRRPISTTATTTRSPRSSGCTAATSGGRTSPRSSSAAPRSARRRATPAAPRRSAASSPRCAPRSSATSRARSRATRPRSPQNGSDATALKALVDLYDKTGRTDDYLRTMERLAQVAPEGEKLATLRKLAAELEDRDPARARAARTRSSSPPIRTPTTRTAASSACSRREANWYELVAVLDAPHRGGQDAGAARRALPRRGAGLRASELADPHQGDRAPT